VTYVLFWRLSLFVWRLTAAYNAGLWACRVEFNTGMTKLSDRASNEY